MDENIEDLGVPPSGSGCQPSASAAVPASSQSGIPNARMLRAAQVSGGPRPWAVINGNGPHGDEIVAGYLSEVDAMILPRCATGE